jgi:hypothetical protein
MTCDEGRRRYASRRVAALAQSDLVIEIVAVAAPPD